MASVKQFAWTLMALIFLSVSWLWEAVAPIVQAIIDVLPLRGLKRWANHLLQQMPASLALLMFLIPLGVSEVFKILAFVAFAKRQVVAGAFIYAFAEVVRFGLAAYVWHACREKLLSIAWVAKLHAWLLVVRHWALRQIAPTRAWIRQALVEAGLVGDKAGLWAKVRALWRYTRRKAS